MEWTLFSPWNEDYGTYGLLLSLKQTIATVAMVCFKVSFSLH